MAQAFPEQIHTIRYEDLIRRPIEAYTDILGHFGFSLDGSEKHTACFEGALAATTPDALKDVERLQGHALGIPELQVSHMRGGEVGKWKKWFASDDLDYANKQLNMVGLALDDFVLQ